MAPRSRVAEAGAIVWGGTGARVTVALADPFAPVAVTITVGDAGIVSGAVNSPDAEMLPALAVQLVAPADVNCNVRPRTTVAEVGEIVCDGPDAPLNCAVNAGPASVPGLVTANTADLVEEDE